MTDTFLEKSNKVLGTMDPVQWRPEPNCESFYIELPDEMFDKGKIKTVGDVVDYVMKEMGGLRRERRQEERRKQAGDKLAASKFYRRNCAGHGLW